MEFPKFSLPDKKTIIVTGSNKGIGFEAVRLLSEKLPSSTILLGTRSLSLGEAALTNLRKSDSSSYSNIKPLQIDVTDKHSIASAVEEVKKSYGKLDVLLNNSGINNVDGQKVRVQGVLDVNLYGVHDTIEAFLPILSPSATLITVSSMVGSRVTFNCSPNLQKILLNPSSLTWSNIDSLAKEHISQSPNSPWPDVSTYGVSKALVSPYMRIVAREHPELRVVVVCPGYCATDMNKNIGDRSAVQGGESVTWPVFNEFESGHFYQDGIEYPWLAESHKNTKNK